MRRPGPGKDEEDAHPSWLRQTETPRLSLFGPAGLQSMGPETGLPWREVGVAGRVRSCPPLWRGGESLIHPCSLPWYTKPPEPTTGGPSRR